MSLDMYDFIDSNIHKLKYDLNKGIIITPKNTNGTVCSTTGYLRVKVSKKTLQVHQILSVLYFGEDCIGMTVNHKNGDKLNNKKSNLELISLSENAKHAHTNGLCTYKKGEDVHNSKLTEKDVLDIRIKLRDGHPQRLLATEYKVSKGCIQGIKQRKTWKHL